MKTSLVNSLFLEQGRDQITLFVSKKKKRGSKSFFSAFVRCRWVRITKVMGFMLGRFCKVEEVFFDIFSTNVMIVCFSNKGKAHQVIMWLLVC